MYNIAKLCLQKQYMPCRHFSLFSCAYTRTFRTRLWGARQTSSSFIYRAFIRANRVFVCLPARVCDEQTKTEIAPFVSRKREQIRKNWQRIERNPDQLAIIFCNANVLLFFLFLICRKKLRLCFLFNSVLQKQKI